MINRKFFFEQVRGQLFGGKLSALQVAGLTFILDVWERDHAEKDDRWLAYALATAFHETARTMQPIREKGTQTYFTRLYDPSSPDPKRAALARRMGNTKIGDGAKWSGRGFVQLTWANNYRDMGLRLGLPLYDKPDLALDPDVAAQIMFVGMEKGAFTGKGFDDYFAGDRADWVNARRIINSLDRAVEIAGYAKAFYAAISYTVAKVA